MKKRIAAEEERYLETLARWVRCLPFQSYVGSRRAWSRCCVAIFRGPGQTVFSPHLNIIGLLRGGQENPWVFQRRAGVKKNLINK